MSSHRFRPFSPKISYLLSEIWHFVIGSSCSADWYNLTDLTLQCRREVILSLFSRAYNDPFRPALSFLSFFQKCCFRFRQRVTISWRFGSVKEFDRPRWSIGKNVLPFTWNRVGQKNLSDSTIFFFSREIGHMDSYLFLFFIEKFHSLILIFFIAIIDKINNVIFLI